MAENVPPRFRLFIIGHFRGVAQPLPSFLFLLSIRENEMDAGLKSFEIYSLRTLKISLFKVEVPSPDPMRDPGELQDGQNSKNGGDYCLKYRSVL
jgi:hypothetical protein